MWLKILLAFHIPNPPIHQYYEIGQAETMNPTQIYEYSGFSVIFRLFSGTVLTLFGTVPLNSPIVWLYCCLRGAQLQDTRASIIIAGTDYVVVVTVWGATDPADDNSTGLVKNVTSLQFVSLAGDLLADLPLTELESLKTFIVETQIPTTGFLKLSGSVDIFVIFVVNYTTVELSVTFLDDNL
jgi:hypothetical protein